jgi:ABC-type sugar transport system ATPase subunit
MAGIGLRDIWKNFGKKAALQGVSLAAADGELFCLLGPSGAGKTTTIRVIAGLESPDRGEVTLDGQAITRLSPQQRDIAIAFESYALYPHLTVLENLAFPLKAPARAAQYSKAAVERRVREIADVLNLGELLARFPRQLSGGQRQRVALGRALVREPRAYLLDEPIAHLDATLRHRMRGELKRIQRELGITTIYSTPDQLEALSMADTIAVVNGGEIEQIGTPDEIYYQPANVFVARFVGEPPMNLLDACLQESTLAVRSDEPFRVPVPPMHLPGLRWAVDGQGSGELKVGVRPKDVRLVVDGSDGVHARGQVTDSDPLGETAIVTVSVGSLELKVTMPTRLAPERGSYVGVALDGAELHYFDVDTERRIGTESTVTAHVTKPAEEADHANEEIGLYQR